MNAWGAFLTDDQFIYFKDAKGENGPSRGELFINQEKIDEYVHALTVTYDPDLETLAYLMDWNSDLRHGTLKTYKNGHTSIVSENINSYALWENGEILYLYDSRRLYSLAPRDYTGTLYAYKNGSVQMLTNDVTTLIPVQSGRHSSQFSIYKMTLDYIMDPSADSVTGMMIYEQFWK